MHVDGVPLAKCTLGLPLATPTLVVMMSTSNSQLHRPTSWPRVTTKQSKLLQRAYRLQKQNTRSIHSQLWSPHGPPLSMFVSTHSCATDAPLMNTTMMLKPLKNNLENKNTNNDRTILQKRWHENLCWIRVVWDTSEQVVLVLRNPEIILTRKNWLSKAPLISRMRSKSWFLWMTTSCCSKNSLRSMLLVNQ